MYINWFWILVFVIIFISILIRQRQIIKNTYNAYLEQREIAKVYMQISHNNVVPSKFAKQFVFRMANEADISDDNLIDTLTAWGISPDTARDLTKSHSGDDEQERYDEALIKASDQMTSFLSRK